MNNIFSPSQPRERAPEFSKEGAGFVMVTERALTRHNRYIAQIDRQLPTVKRELAAIDKHCTASDDEFQQAVQNYERKICKAVERAAGLAMMHKQAAAALRRLES